MPDLVYNGPYEAIADFYRDVDQNLTLVLDLYQAEGIAPTCRQGCDACCHQLVMATMAEARAAASEVAASQAVASEVAPRPDLRDRLGAWLSATHDLRRQLQDGADGDLEEVVERLAATYWERRIACPFLVDRRCAIYAARPLACRHHFSVSDPALCDTGKDEVSRMEAVEEAFFAAQDAIPEDEAEIGFFPELVFLILEDR